MGLSGMLKKAATVIEQGVGEVRTALSDQKYTYLFVSINIRLVEMDGHRYGYLFTKRSITR
jgi:hypothetical protein